MLTRREFERLLAGAVVGSAFARSAQARDWTGYEAAVAIDACAGIGDPTSEAAFPVLRPSDVGDVRRSGLTAFTVTLAARGTFEEAIRALADGEREIAAHPDALLGLRRAADLAVAKASRRAAVVYHLQDLSMVGGDADRVEVLYRLGIRIGQLTYNTRNLVGDGCLEPGDAGLSRFGRVVVERMNAIGMLIDLSHCGTRTTAEGIATSKRPMAITHTGCAALHDHPRNKRDQELRACAERGGVVGIYFMPFLRPHGAPTLEDLVRHLEHAIQVCGEDHVGVGSDQDVTPMSWDEKTRAAFREWVAKRQRLGIAAPGEDPEVPMFVAELNQPRRLEVLAGALAGRGHGAARIEKIVGGNFARLFRDAMG